MGFIRCPLFYALNETMSTTTCVTAKVRRMYFPNRKCSSFGNIVGMEMKLKHPTSISLSIILCLEVAVACSYSNFLVSELSIVFAMSSRVSLRGVNFEKWFRDLIKQFTQCITIQKIAIRKKILANDIPLNALKERTQPQYKLQTRPNPCSHLDEFATLTPSKRGHLETSWRNRNSSHGPIFR